MRDLYGCWKYIISTLSIGLVLFQLYTAGFGVLPDIAQRGIHLGFVLVLCYILKPAYKRAPKNYVPFYDVVLVILSAGSTIFLLFSYKQILWDPLVWINNLDAFFAVITVFLVLEASRRCVGMIFPALAIFFLIYAYFGPYFPGAWAHGGFGFDLIFQTFYHSTNGIWGTMVGISATMLAMFGIFSALLSVGGGSQTFVKLGQLLVSKSVGGEAKVALVASSLMGMISGSAMANVVATGTFTIPLMKKARYSNEWAAAISALGSTGGQLMPPIMGAGAFIMAQLLGIPYLKIVVAAIIPALLYYVGAYVAVHFISLKENIKGEKLNESIGIYEYINIFVPIIIFIYFLAIGYTVTTAAFYSTIGGFVTIILSFCVLNKNISALPARSLKLFYDISISGSTSILEMASLLAGAQITITLISMTGLGVKFSDLIVSIGQGNLFLCLILSMIVCVILGMGLPTTAAYVLAASILAPALISLGIEPLVAHLFVFFFSVLSTITPPVCAAVYLSSGIAKANWLKTGLLSVMIALPAFIVPYTFIYNQSLLLKGSLFDVIVATITALLGVIAVGIGVAGYIKTDLNLFYRSLVILGGILLIVPQITVSVIGIIIVVFVYMMNARLKRLEGVGQNYE